jgi:hypothetical protein
VAQQAAEERGAGTAGIVGMSGMTGIDSVVSRLNTKIHLEALDAWGDGRYLIASFDASMVPMLLKEAHATRLDEGHLPMIEAVLCGGVPTADVCRRAVHATTNSSVTVSDLYKRERDRAMATHLLKMIGC